MGYMDRVRKVNKNIVRERRFRGYSKWKFDYPLAYRVWREEFQGPWWLVIYWVSMFTLTPVVIISLLAFAGCCFTVAGIMFVIQFFSSMLGDLLTSKKFYGFLAFCAIIGGIVYYAGFAHK